mmetsp:Transcript_20563/g.48703  ORF Transcript_20563/g.48703 Transcript_20563/m.48703 type:complete len:342 (+) Transcript_20563:380-1405(+)
MDLGARDLLRPRDVVLEINVLPEVHLGGEHLEDEPLLAPPRLRELDLAVEAARPQQRRVERVGAVGAHDHLNVDRLVEAVHLREKLHEDALHLAVGAGLRVEALGGDGVDLVDEDDRGRVLARQPEDVAYHPRPLAQVLLHKLGADDTDERGGGVVGDGLREHRLAGAGRAVEQHAARRVDADRPVQVEVRQRQLDRLPHLLLLHVAAADVRVAHVGPLRGAHQRDGRVGLRREHVDDRIRVPVERHGRAALQQLAVDGRQHPHVVVGAGSGADDAVVVVDDLEELADDKRDRLDALHLLLCAHVLTLQVVDLVFDVLLLDLEKLEDLLQRLHLGVHVGLR